MTSTIARDPHTPGFGEPAPFFTAATDGNPSYSIDVAAGRWIVLMVFGTLENAICREAHARILGRRAIFNDADAAFFGVSIDPRDAADRGLRNAAIGLRYFWDFDRKVCRTFGLADDSYLKPTVVLIDRAFRVLMAEPVEGVDAVLDRLQQELTNERREQDGPYAPVLTLPRVFEPDFCRRLVAYFGAHDPSPSGFAADVGGRTVHQFNPRLKRREDVSLEDEELRASIEEKLRSRLFPFIRRAFGWSATEIERFLIGRYAAADSGFFFAHRDDATVGTAHRKFAVTINLNADEYEGGDLRFPEFGRRTYRPPTGGATVFCCSLLHEVTPVTEGERYAFLPFLFDAHGEKLRRASLRSAADGQRNRRARRGSKGRH